jgi:hypothetical protein
MAEEETQQKAKIKPWEIFWIVFEGLIALVGLFFLVSGIVGDYLPVKASENWILSAETSWMTLTKTSLNWRWLGVLCLLLAALLAVITLNFFAKKSDVDEERAIRRAQRLQVLSQSAPAEEIPASSAAPAAPSPEKKQ